MKIGFPVTTKKSLCSQLLTNAQKCHKKEACLNRTCMQKLINAQKRNATKKHAQNKFMQA